MASRQRRLPSGRREDGSPADARRRRPAPSRTEGRCGAAWTRRRRSRPSRRRRRGRRRGRCRQRRRARRAARIAGHLVGRSSRPGTALTSCRGRVTGVSPASRSPRRPARPGRAATICFTRTRRRLVPIPTLDVPPPGFACRGHSPRRVIVGSQSFRAGFMKASPEWSPDLLDTRRRVAEHRAVRPFGGDPPRRGGQRRRGESADRKVSCRRSWSARRSRSSPLPGAAQGGSSRPCALRALRLARTANAHRRARNPDGSE